MTTYTHKENQSVKNYGEVLREFNHLRRTDDEFARDYRSTEVNRYIMDNYLTTPLEIETNSEEELAAIAKDFYTPEEADRMLSNLVIDDLKDMLLQYNESQKVKKENFSKWVERLDNILLVLETHSPSINQVSIDDLANVIAEMKNNSQSKIK